MSLLVRKLKQNYRLCFLRLKYKNIGAADPTRSSTGKNSRNNVFRRRQTTKKVPPSIFRGFEARKKCTIDVLLAKGQNEK